MKIPPSLEGRVSADVVGVLSTYYYKKTYMDILLSKIQISFSSSKDSQRSWENLES